MKKLLVVPVIPTKPVSLVPMEYNTSFDYTYNISALPLFYCITIFCPVM